MFFKYAKALCNLFNVDLERVLKLTVTLSTDKQVGIAMRTHPFVMRENYLENHRKIIYQIVLNFFKLYIGSSDSLLSVDGHSHNNSF